MSDAFVDSNASSCHHCLTFTASVELRQLQPNFNDFIFYFPFDQQEIKLEMTASGAALAGCEGNGLTSPALASLGLTEQNKNDVLLPPTREYVFNLPLHQAVFTRHMTDSVTGVPLLDTCELVLIVQRNSAVFVFRAVVTTIIVVLGSVITAVGTPHPSRSHVGSVARLHADPTPFTALDPYRGPRPLLAGSRTD